MSEPKDTLKQVWQDAIVYGKSEIMIIPKTEYDALQAKLEKAKENLLRYGSHHTGCACLSDTYDGEFDIPCTCGFSHALQESEK